MKTELEEIKKELESTLEGFKDAYENYGYDLANERYHVETALKKVNLLLLHGVSNSLDLVELERKIDEALDSETSESLKEWLHSKRL